MKSQFRDRLKFESDILICEVKFLFVKFFAVAVDFLKLIYLIVSYLNKIYFY